MVMTLNCDELIIMTCGRWSYDVGLIHFVGMSTEHDYTVGSEQYLWLEADLAGVDRTGVMCVESVCSPAVICGSVESNL